jgi:hemolysin III
MDQSSGRERRAPILARSRWMQAAQRGAMAQRPGLTVSMAVPIRPLREEIVSALIQGGAAVASAVGLVYLVTRAWPQHNAVSLAAIVVYCASMFVAFLASSFYHGLQQKRIKPILRAIDQCTIFLFIAGTYTPFALLSLRHHTGGILLASIWTLAIGGIVLRLTNAPIFHRATIPLYLATGWLCLGWGIPLYQTVGTVPISLMFAGGLCYTGGLLFYRCDRLPFSTPMWHLCVVAGSASFFLAISRVLQI